MSTLLEQASLVMIPSGYKEDIVYSQIPTSGAGDLSFTRASNGTRVNSAGLVEVTPWNLVEQSETFDSATWTKQNNITVTANTITAPNGTLTADTLEKASGSGGVGFYYIVQTVNTFEQLTNFFYVKYKSGSGIVWLLGKNSGTFAFYDVINGTALSATGGMTTSIESVGNGWYKCIFSQTYVGATSTEFGIGLCLTDGTPNYNATTAATQSAYIWGAQSSIAATAKPYFPTTDRLNVPRLTYQNGGGGCPSLLLEKQSTNLVTYSEDFTQADWPKQNTIVTANATTSPDGTQNADKLIANTTNARHLIFQSITTSNTHTFTTYAKAGENSFLIMRLDTDSPEIKTWFNLSNGTIGTSQGGSPTITSVGNGWYRCSVQYTPSTSSNIYAVLYTAKTDGVEGFAGNDSDGTYIWGAQLEASSYPTSYIPTTSASATRVADACSKTGISSLIGQTEGTLFADFLTGGLPSIDQYYMNISDGSTSNIIYIGFYANILVARIIDAGSLIVNINVGLATNTRYKVGFAYKANDCVLYINGSNSGSDTSTTVPATSKLSFNDFSNEACYQLNESVLFKTRLTNAELASLTTL